MADAALAAKLADADARVAALEAKLADGAGGGGEAEVRERERERDEWAGALATCSSLAPRALTPRPAPPSVPQAATTIEKLQYQVLHLTRSLKAADAALDAALAPGADVEACRRDRWAAPLNQKGGQK